MKFRAFEQIQNHKIPVGRNHCLFHSPEIYMELGAWVKQSGTLKIIYCGEYGIELSFALEESWQVGGKCTQ